MIVKCHQKRFGSSHESLLPDVSSSSEPENPTASPPVMTEKKADNSTLFSGLKLQGLRLLLIFLKIQLIFSQLSPSFRGTSNSSCT
ncbi:hypothetical protein DSO57_1013212 [Entomophthora muscae]|uniref:Uncharacterized protein n=1 Tax=Entomophthora muscae TaxID=34485 RepID=A0ACC2RWW5_9FUNG|nr:hypothetical protein DSO57_1013212 [Entomophthora muscae]